MNEQDLLRALLAHLGSTASTATPHISEEELADLLTGLCNADARERIDAHLEACSHCRQRLLDIDEADQEAIDLTELSVDLARDLNDSDANVRRRAIDAFSHLGELAATPGLLHLMNLALSAEQDEETLAHTSLTVRRLARALPTQALAPTLGAPAPQPFQEISYTLSKLLMPFLLDSLQTLKTGLSRILGSRSDDGQFASLEGGNNTLGWLVTPGAEGSVQITLKSSLPKHLGASVEVHSPAVQTPLLWPEALDRLDDEDRVIGRIVVPAAWLMSIPKEANVVLSIIATDGERSPSL
jgi:hypothetical protein